jgi:hypothetical protein
MSINLSTVIGGGIFGPIGALAFAAIKELNDKIENK